MSIVRSRFLRFGLLASLMASTGCGGTGDSDADAPPSVRVEGPRLILPADSPELASLTTSPVVPAVAKPVTLNGRLVWNEDVTVRVFSPFAGRVVRVLVEAGQSVKAGQVLAEIAAPDFGQAQADAMRAATDLALAERTLTRQRDLLTHGVVAAKDVEAAEADVQRARAEQERATARLALYGGGEGSVSQVFPLKAPLGGVVVERALTPGQEVRPDQMLANAPQLFAPLFVITDPTRLWVLLDLPENQLSTLQPGAALALHASSWPDRSFPGRVTLAASEVDPSTRTVKVRGTVENPNRLLKAEMLVSVEAPGPPVSGLAVPVSAVLLEGDTHMVMVEEERGLYRRCKVRVGPARGDMIPVLEGLHPGEQVVTSSSLLLEQLYQSTPHS